MSTSCSLRTIIIILGRRWVIVYLSLLLLKALSLVLFLLVSVKELNVSVDYGFQVIQSMIGTNCGNFKLASLLLLFDVELHDSTFLVEEAQVLLIGTADILDKGIVKWDKDAFKNYFSNGIFHVSFGLAIDSDLTLVSASD